jgi:hypothetical protein
LASLRCLRTLNLRRNALVTAGMPPEMFESEELNTLDLSHNQVTILRILNFGQKV